MRSLKEFLSENKKGTLLIIFPHADDESFVSGGLLQLTEKIGVKTMLVTLSNGVFGEDAYEREKEYQKATKYLGVDDCVIWKYKEGELGDLVDDWSRKLSSIIGKVKPFAILTFDPNGVTGNKDHIVSSISILNLIKRMKSNRPYLLWRISDKEEKLYFYRDKGLVVDKNATFSCNLTLRESIKKLKAIFTYKSQLKSILFRLRVLDWYLFDHKELFYMVEFKKDNFDLILES